MQDNFNFKYILLFTLSIFLDQWVAISAVFVPGKGWIYQQNELKN